MTLQTKLQSLYRPFQNQQRVKCPVYHYTRGNNKSVPYIVWSEDAENDSFHSDNHKTEQKLTGIVDFYTKTEFDTTADTIQEILDEEGLGWRLESVLYEEETYLIHYQWRWWIG